MSTTPAPDRMDRFYRGVRAVARFWLWFLFRSVDARHPERVPVGGPILLCVNHPNNFIDSLVVGSVVRRKVHYLATASMFRNTLMARFLLACGAIPVYRRQDDPGKMDKNLDTFAACFTTFARGRLVAIYPEGTTHAEARVQRIKTGAARIALEYEASHPGELRMIPVGLSFEARKAFRSRVLVAFGEPIQPAAYLRAYREDPVKAVDALTRDLQWAMETQVVNVERIDDQRLVHAVEELYRDDLTEQVMQSRGLRRRDVDPVRLSRSIADAVAHFKAREPERVESLWQSIQAYRSLLAQYHQRDEAVRRRRERLPARAKLVYSWDAIAGFPLFGYGALVNALPYYVPRWLAHRMARKETDYATIRLLASVVAFPLFWGLEIWLVFRAAGAWWALAFALSLPISGTIAYRYLIGAGWLRVRLRFAALSATQSQAARRLVAEREAIVAELERARQDYIRRHEREQLLSVYRLEEMSSPALDKMDRASTVVLLTVSPLEEHGPHLPVGVDAFAARHFAETIAERLVTARPGWSAILLPTLHLGSFTFETVGTISVRQRVVRDVMVDYGEALARSGFRFILVANGHGGPGHLTALDEAAAIVSRRHGVVMASFTGHLAWEFLRGRYVDAIEAELGRPLTAAERGAFAEDAHGGWWETSLMLLLRPDLVDESFRTLPPARYSMVRRIVPNYPLKNGGQGYVGHPALADPTFAKATTEVLIREAMTIVEGLLDGRLKPSDRHSPFFQVPFFRTNFWRAAGATAAVAGIGLGLTGWLRNRRRRPS